MNSCFKISNLILKFVYFSVRKKNSLKLKSASHTVCVPKKLL